MCNINDIEIFDGYKIHCRMLISLQDGIYTVNAYCSLVEIRHNITSPHPFIDKSRKYERVWGVGVLEKMFFTRSYRVEKDILVYTVCGLTLLCSFFIDEWEVCWNPSTPLFILGNK